MRTFIAETFVPRERSDEVAVVSERLAGLDDAMPVRYVRTTFVPGDEVCFHVFEAESADDVKRVADRLGIELDRVAEAREGFG